jgi:hypothetical protein
MSSGPHKRPAALWVLLCVLMFQGISATPPGLLLILDPTGGLMKMPLSMLHGSPFHGFLIPGLILCVVLGLGALLVAAGLFFMPVWAWTERLNPFKGIHWSWMAAVTFGVALMGWITVQVAMIGGGSWLQLLYFGVGLAILVLSLAPSMRSHLVAPPQRSPAQPDCGSAR